MTDPAAPQRELDDDARLECRICWYVYDPVVGDPVRAKKISDILLAEYGVYVQPINFPTVPRGTERLRFTPGPAHTAEMMDDLTQALVEIWDRMELELQRAA